VGKCTNSAIIYLIEKFISSHANTHPKLAVHGGGDHSHENKLRKGMLDVAGMRIMDINPRDSRTCLMKILRAEN
jgi:hypothetical protein